MSLSTALVITKSSLSPRWISCSRITLVTADLWQYCTKHRCQYIGTCHNKWHHVNTTLTQSYHKDDGDSDRNALVLGHDPCGRHSILAETTHDDASNGESKVHTLSRAICRKHCQQANSLEGGARAEGDDVGAAIRNSYPEWHSLKYCCIYQPLSPAPARPIC